MTINQLEELKRELTRIVENSENQWMIDNYYKGHNRFVKYVNQMQERRENLNNKEIEAMAFINKINKYDLEFMMKEL